LVDYRYVSLTSNLRTLVRKPVKRAEITKYSVLFDYRNVAILVVTEL